MIYDGTTFTPVWEADLADSAPSWTWTHINVGSVIARGKTYYILIGLKALSPDAPTSNAWWRYYTHYPWPLLYSKDVLLVKELTRGQTVQVCRANDNTLIGSSIAGADGKALITVTTDELLPGRRVYFKIFPVPGVSGDTWTSPDIDVYGGDILTFSG